MSSLRRASPRLSLTCGVLLVLAALLCPSRALTAASDCSSLLPSPPLVFHAAEYGAVADDGLDDTSALQSAIDAAILRGPHSAVLLSSGQYDLNSSLLFDSACYFTFQGDSPSTTLLLVHAVSGVIEFTNSAHLTFSDFAIDFSLDFLPFTAGVITNLSTSAPYTFDLQVAPPHPVQAGKTSPTILVYDVQNQRPASGPNALEIYQSIDPSRGSTIVGDGVVRFALEVAGAFEVGQALVVRYEGGPHAINGRDCYDVSIHSVVVYTAHSMSHASNRIHGLSVVDYHVRKAAGRWMSTYADCMHFGDHRTSISIVNSSCEGMGDDGLNVHSYYFNVTDLLNDTSVVMSLHNKLGWLDTLNVGVGAIISFSHASSPYIAYASYEVVALSQHSSSSYVYTFTTSIAGAVLYDLAYVSGSPSLLLSNFTVSNNRARGVLLETHNVTIERSLFQFTSGPALLFQPSQYWGEAQPGANVTVTETVFEGCNQGIAQQEGVIAILPDPVQLVAVVDDVTVERSTFLQGEYSGALLQDWNGGRVTLQDNWIDNLTSHVPPVLVCNSRGLLVQHNRAWNGSRAEFGMDSDGVCSDSLSSQLSAAIDAFNATFDPHVMPAPSGYGVVILNSQLSSSAQDSATGSWSSKIQAKLSVLAATAYALLS